MASATQSSVHEGAAVSSSMPPLKSALKSALKSRPAWDSRTRRILNGNGGCRTNLKLYFFHKWCYQLPLVTCSLYYYVATTGRLKECQVREGQCGAFTTKSVVGCAGSEVRHALAWHLLPATLPSSTSP